MDADRCSPVRENRRGYVLVHPDIFPSDVEMLRSRMIVCSEDPPERGAYYGECTRITGYAREFKALPLGSAPLEYEAIFTGRADGSRSMAFMPLPMPRGQPPKPGEANAEIGGASEARMPPDRNVLIRENRLGYVLIAKFWAEGREARLTRERMVVCAEEQHETYSPILRWTGYAPEFAPLPLGSAPLPYQAIARVVEDGSLAIEFRPYADPCR